MTQMSKKQKPSVGEIARHRSWDLAKVGTNVLIPRGMEGTPWPRWLSKTFVNIHLLQENPLDVREDLFGGGRHPDNAWGLVDNLLYAIEDQAKKVLEKYPLPERFRDVVNNDFSFDGHRLSETEFYACFENENFTPKQENAIAALRSIQIIRSETYAINNRGYYMCDPHHDHTYRSLTVAELIMETTTLIVAALRGELWEDVWSYIAKMREDKNQSRPGRETLLQRELSDAIETLNSRNVKPTARKVWDYLVDERAGKGCIVSVEQYHASKSRQLAYLDNSGIRTSITFQQFEKRLSRSRKRKKNF